MQRIKSFLAVAIGVVFFFGSMFLSMYAGSDRVEDGVMLGL